MRRMLAAALAAFALAAPYADAHGDRHATTANDAARTASETDFGRPGDPRKVTRTIRIEMDDAMHYSVDRITVRRGETVRFIAHNVGNVLHEMVLGTAQEISAHAELMRRFPGMEHDEAHQLHVQPGARGEMVWEFSRAGEFRFACLMPGHLEAGMVGHVTVTDDRGEAAREVSRSGRAARVGS